MDESPLDNFLEIDPVSVRAVCLFAKGADFSVARRIKYQVVRLSKDRVTATTDSIIFWDTEQAGIDPGITRAVPVTLGLVFDAD